MASRDQRVLTKTHPKDDMPSRDRDADPRGRPGRRSTSVSPTNRNHDHHHHHHGGVPPTKVTISRTRGEYQTNAPWNVGRGQSTPILLEIHANGQLVIQDKRHQNQPPARGRRNSDAKPPAHIQAAPPPRPVHFTPSSPAELPVIPRAPSPPKMGFWRNLLGGQKDNQRILFYNKNEPYYGFTNFSSHPVTYQGKEYPTSEHLFQSLKFTHKPHLMEHIRTYDPRPSVAFSEARRLAHEVRPDWKRDNINSMNTALYLKFTQHRRLRRELLGTGEAELVENSDKDAFWGCGADGNGRNELGKALMRLRERLRREGWQ